jgi:hypothetical protein
MYGCTGCNETIRKEVFKKAQEEDKRDTCKKQVKEDSEERRRMYEERISRENLWTRPGNRDGMSVRSEDISARARETTHQYERQSNKELELAEANHLNNEPSAEEILYYRQQRRLQNRKLLKDVKKSQKREEREKMMKRMAESSDDSYTSLDVTSEDKLVPEHVSKPRTPKNTKGEKELRKEKATAPAGTRRKMQQEQAKKKKDEIFNHFKPATSNQRHLRAERRKDRIGKLRLFTSENCDNEVIVSLGRQQCKVRMAKGAECTVIHKTTWELYTRGGEIRKQDIQDYVEYKRGKLQDRKKGRMPIDVYGTNGGLMGHMMHH